MKNRKSPLFCLAAFCLGIPAAQGATLWWKGNSGASWNSNVQWSTTDSNTGPNASAKPGSADDVVFNANGINNSARTIPLAATQSVLSITFVNAQTTTISANLSSGTGNKSLTIGAGGITKNSGSGTVNINGNVGNGSTGNISVVVGADQTWTNNSASALNIGTAFISGTTSAATMGLGIRTLTLAGDGDFNFGTATTSNSMIGVSTGSTIDKGGAGTLSIGGVNDFAGTTKISGGTLALLSNGAIANSPTIIVGASTTFDVSGVSGGYSLGAAQTLSGTGNVVGSMSVAGTLSPGASPGIMTTGSQTWVNGGDYTFEMLDATGAAGTGFDQIQITGTLDLSSLTAGGFGINLFSLSSISPDVSGDALNFDNTIDQSWAILTTTGGITGFDAANFALSSAGFTNALGGGAFSLSATPNNLVLNFTAVPEPGAALLGGLGMLALLRRRR
jgi:hypothetical protein